MLSFSAGLILISTVLLLFTERSSPAFEGLTIHERFLAALFHAITPRTAGFNTVNTAQLSQAGSFLTMMLMFIGAGPGSTGGGIKVTTFAAVVLSVAANAKRKADVNLYHRRLTPEQTSRAYSSTALYAFLVMGGCFILCASQAFFIRDALLKRFPQSVRSD
jgi:trk system potassium uptake protein TrkH